MQYGIATEDIFNFDEIGYAMGLTVTYKVVICREYYSKCQVVGPRGRKWVTSIECINSIGWALSPVIIFKAKTHL